MDDIEDILRRLGIIEEELSYILGEEKIDNKKELRTRLMEEAYTSLQMLIVKLAKFVELSKLEMKM